MIGLVIIAHAPLGSALLACAKHVFGKEPEAFAVVDIDPKADPANEAARCTGMLPPLDSGDGILVLTDLFGATPANIAAQLVRPGRLEVLTGVNLPMLLRALSYRSTVNLDVLVDKAKSGATDGVMKLVSTAPQNQRPLAVSREDSTKATDRGPYDALARLHHQQ